ncbi:MAG: RlmE family RNA methyltransferase [Treponema sp.]|nr:RlmE family RNA methyltransferase [Treponema sp.]MBR4629351.1 RlmE family RNA methyltransferase [Treponema sp.]MBR6913010.1 RlmE family RNA methyltransferase [Treponema sp.]MCR5125393.1 RlmE family RNA methyltransferase [Treponema sp.]
MGNSYEKPDFWSRKAFSEGYPARSVYKLKEIDEKFGMIKKGYSVLDLGAAPGSWTTFLLRTLKSLGESEDAEKQNLGKVVSCDLNPLAKDVRAENLVFIQGDLNEKSIVDKIRNEGPFDLVVCDAAPLTTGNRVVDTARSQGLVKMAIWYAQSMLKTGGNFAVKIFQNGDQQALLKMMREIFTTAKGFKPVACRSESFETYLIGIKKK